MLNRDILDTIFRGLRSDFEGALAIKGEDESISDFVMEVASSTASERFDWLGDLPDARKWLGPRVIHQLGNFKYEVFHDHYEVTLKVMREDILDDRIGIYKLQALQGGEAMRLLKPRLICQALNEGDVNLCYDGQPFFSASHPVGKDGDISSVSNLLDNGGAQAAHPWYLMDSRRTVKPIMFVNRESPSFQSFQDMTNLHTFMNREYLFGAHCRYGSGYGLWQTATRNEGVLNYTTVKAAWDAMVAYTSDERSEDAGTRKKLGIRPNLLVVGESNYLAARALVENQYLQSLTDPLAIGSSTAPNPFRGLFKVVVCSWLP